MKDVVAAYDAGQLGKPDSTGAVQLPDKDAWLSGSGSIVVRGSGSSEQILFVDRVGILGSHWAVLYTANDQLGRYDPMDGRIVQSTRLEPDWYYVSAKE